MSVFLRNNCTYPSCGQIFSSLNNLIIHIENDHLDFDPDAMDQLENGKPEHVPLSYVLRFNGVGDGGGDNGGISCADIDIEKAAAVNFTAEEPVKADIPCCDRVARVATRLDMPSIAPVIFNRNNIMQRRGGDSVDINNNKSAKRQMTTALLHHDSELAANNNHHHRLGGSSRTSLLASTVYSHHEKLYQLDNANKKPFVCSVQGCWKRYKNVNGIKYHYKTFHKIIGMSSLSRKYKNPPHQHQQSKEFKQNNNNNNFLDDCFYRSTINSTSKINSDGGGGGNNIFDKITSSPSPSNSRHKCMANMFAISNDDMRGGGGNYYEYHDYLYTNEFTDVALHAADAPPAAVLVAQQRSLGVPATKAFGGDNLSANSARGSEQKAMSNATANFFINNNYYH